MDGIAALKQIMRECPTQVLMVSGVTTEGAGSRRLPAQTHRRQPGGTGQIGQGGAGKDPRYRRPSASSHPGTGTGGETRTGGTIIAQDERTCVVYGMPRAVVEAGLADAICPLEEIAAAIVHHLK